MCGRSGRRRRYSRGTLGWRCRGVRNPSMPTTVRGRAHGDIDRKVIVSSRAPHKHTPQHGEKKRGMNLDEVGAVWEVVLPAGEQLVDVLRLQHRATGRGNEAEQGARASVQRPSAVRGTGAGTDDHEQAAARRQGSRDREGPRARHNHARAKPAGPRADPHPRGNSRPWAGRGACGGL